MATVTPINPYDELNAAKAAMQRMMEQFTSGNSVKASDIDAMAVRLRRAVVLAAQAAAIEVRDSSELDPRDYDMFSTHAVSRGALARLFDVLGVPRRDYADDRPTPDVVATLGQVDPEVEAMTNAYLEG